MTPPGTPAIARSAGRRLLPHLLAAALAACATTSPATAEDNIAAASAYLVEALRSPQRAEATLAALKATGDAELATVFAAVSRSGDKNYRMLGTFALRDFGGPVVAAALLDRVRNDPEMPIRAEALMALIRQKAVTHGHLVEALGVSDESIQCIAARELARRGKAEAASATLSRLAGSKDPGTAAMARLSLLAVGDKRQMPVLRELATNAKTPDAVLALVMEQIAEETIVPASPLAQSVAASDCPEAIRGLAFKAVAVTSGQAASLLKDEIVATKSLLFAVRLLRLLADREDAEPPLKTLSAGEGPVAVLARLELERRTGGQPLADAAKAVVAQGHPLVVDYMMDRAARAIEAGGRVAWPYVPALLRFLQAMPPDSPSMTLQHMRAANAATMLADVGTPKSIAGLKAILAERFNPRVRAVAAGLLKARNPSIRALLEPLLDSPYAELATDAALALGRLGDPSAAKYLGRIVEQRSRHSPALVILASWYLLKTTGHASQTAAALADSVK